MESIKHSIAELTQQFNTQMTEFQKQLISTNSTASPTSNLAVQFNMFRSFVLTALEALQQQVQLLTKQCDSLEMHSRRKILLVHGIAEDKEDTASHVIQALTEHLKIPELCIDDVSRCQRLGKISPGKPRPILLKFRDLSVRNQIWYSKTSLKNSGITLSEFLTRSRHETFMVARQRFGISKCWTKNGYIIIIGPDSKRHSIVSCAELDKITPNPEPRGQGNPTSTSAKLATAAKQAIRTRRIIKK